MSACRSGPERYRNFGRSDRPITLAPLDIDAILASVRKTGHLLIVDTSWTMCGAGSEIIARIVEETGEQVSQK